MPHYGNVAPEVEDFFCITSITGASNVPVELIKIEFISEEEIL